MQRHQTAKIGPKDPPSVIVPVTDGEPRRVDLSVLLVSRSDDWVKAVEHATRQLGSGTVATCEARDAITRLAGVEQHYSHVLVDEADADGLFSELIDITIEIVEPEIDMFSLGQALVHRPHIRVIRAPTPQYVHDALATHSPAYEAVAIGVDDLKAALDGAMIETRYQPIVRIDDRRPVGMEALARLIHPSLGTVLPDRFVPQIENAGLSQELTRIVSHRAFADLTGPFLWNRNLCMSVNFPLDVLEAPDAIRLLEQQRKAFRIPAEQIVVELTESHPVSDVAALRSALEHLRGVGYRIAIDDAGPAVPTLDALIDLPFTCLKFDKEIVQDVIRSPDVRDFVARTTEAAKRRGLFIIAEGVETDEIWHEIAALGVDAVQGFLAARPLPVAAIPIWWDSWKQDTRPA